MQNENSDENDSTCSFITPRDEEGSHQNNTNKKPSLTQTTAASFDFSKMLKELQFTECRSQLQPCCHLQMNATICKLKESTKRLLGILDQIQSKTNGKLAITDNNLPADDPQPSTSTFNVAEIIPCEALKSLEYQTRVLQAINIESEDDDCSIYKKLTRKCQCLNVKEYNDFVIHFNENTKYTTNNIGEIVKNMRILKKFLYMGSEYTKNALMFLNEAWAASLLHKLADLEEGRRYLNFNSKITNDIKKVIRKRISQLEADTVDTLNEVLNLLRPLFVKNPNVTYVSKSANEGIGTRTIKDLVEYREHMTIDEIFMHLDILRNFSQIEFGKEELTFNLPALLLLFKDLLREYDNSEMNILIMNMLNNIMTKHIKNNQDNKSGGLRAVANALTEPIKRKNEGCQMPPKKNIKKPNKSKGLGVSPVKYLQRSKLNQSMCKDSNREPSKVLNRSKKFDKDLRASIIIVPIEK
ncbi:uncharacterized protein LOC123697004 isoform X2 [Colias croceus]|uniref:uncharacterized protein LOC123697004 isoform X2 n=1 Tax=Colias crocea TaxID=72248 RepID=UPI001E27F66E|nr:uncharacterized protein LOC123697004 isoform X2 [Colias croceus]